MKRKTFTAVTSQQVAQLAGVSQSAVSRTFTPGASISPATREKVLKAARELGYRPNAIARSLNTARSRIIGVVISYFDNQFYPQVLEALAQKLDTLNYHLLLFVGDREGNVDRIFDQIWLRASRWCCLTAAKRAAWPRALTAITRRPPGRLPNFYWLQVTSGLLTWAAWRIRPSTWPVSGGI